MDNSGVENGSSCGSKTDNNLPPGFRFDPTDEELVGFFLRNKVLDSDHSWVCDIPEVDLHRCEPWDLPRVGNRGEKDRYYFGLRDRKYPTGTRSNRATKAGYWKATGKDRCIFNLQSRSKSGKQQLLGMKKTLVFYAGRAPRGQKTNWVMHEYSLAGNNGHLAFPNKNAEWVLCRVFRKISKKSDGAASCPSSSTTSLINSCGESSQQLLLHNQHNFPKPAFSHHDPSISRMSNTLLRGDEFKLLVDSWIRPATSSLIPDIKTEEFDDESLSWLISPRHRLHVASTDQDIMPTLIQTSDPMGSDILIDQSFAFPTQCGAELDNVISSVIPV